MVNTNQKTVEEGFNFIQL